MRHGIVAIIACIVLPLASAGYGVEATDYSAANHWLHVPQNNNQPIDVFYLYPTAWTPGPGDGLVCDIDNPSMLAGAANAFTTTATAFSPIANIYAPYYRQTDAGASLALTPEEREALLRGAPATDAIAAFAHYLENDNNGRPFILAGHSQGSQTLLYLMDTYLKDHPEVRERMVAATSSATPSPRTISTKILTFPSAKVPATPA